MRVYDPRPINDETYINVCKNQLLSFLKQRNCPSSLLDSLESTNNVVSIFHFLLEHLDPNLKFGSKADEDIHFIFKFLYYPLNINNKCVFNPVFEDVETTISPTQILLVCWLIELSKYLLHWHDENVVRVKLF